MASNLHDLKYFMFRPSLLPEKHLNLGQNGEQWMRPNVENS